MKHTLIFLFAFLFLTVSCDYISPAETDLVEDTQIEQVEEEVVEVTETVVKPTPKTDVKRTGETEAIETPVGTSVPVKVEAPKAFYLANEVDQEPLFPGAEEYKWKGKQRRKSTQLFEIWLIENLEYPADSVPVDEILVQFDVTTDGKVTNVVAMDKTHGEWSKEAERVIKHLNTDGIVWTPGVIDDTLAVKTRLFYPIVWE